MHRQPVRNPKRKTHLVKLEMQGYEPFEIMLNRKVSGWVWGNIVFGGFIGWAIDAATGGLYKIEPDEVMATLEKLGELKAKGILTQEEFDAKKAELLKKLV